MADRKSDLTWALGVTKESIMAADPEKRAALIAQYRGILSELAALEKDVGKAGDPVDEIAARRAARGGSTARKRRAAGSS